MYGLLLHDRGTARTTTCGFSLISPGAARTEMMCSEPACARSQLRGCRLQALLKRISDEGHTVGSHTVDHISLDNLDTTRVEYELAGLEQTLTGLGIAAPKVGFFHAPFHHKRCSPPRPATD